MSKNVVLIHGTNAGPWTLDSFFEHFSAEGFQCHAPALLHHDDLLASDAQDKLVGVGIADYVAEIKKFIDELDGEPILVGHSLGGVISQLLAAQSEIRGIVLLNGSVNWGIHPTTGAECELGRLFMSAGRFWEGVLLPDFETMARFGLNRVDPAHQRSVFERLGPESGRVLFELFFWMFDEHRTTKIDYGAIKCKSLHISGSDDLAIPPSTSRKIAEKHGSKADFREIRGCGHYLTHEPRWQEVADMCSDWMKRL